MLSTDVNTLVNHHRPLIADVGIRVHALKAHVIAYHLLAMNVTKVEPH